MWYQWLFTLSCYCSYLLVKKIMDVSCLSWKPQVLEWKEMKEISKRLMAINVTESTHKQHGLWYRDTNSCYRYQTAMWAKEPAEFYLFCFYFSCLSTLWQIERRCVSVQVLKVETWRWGEFFFYHSCWHLQTYLLCVHDQQVDRVYASSVRQSNQGNSGKPRSFGYSSTLQVFFCWRSTGCLTEPLFSCQCIFSSTDAVVFKHHTNIFFLI